VRGTFAGIFGTWLLASVALTAADFWEKDFTLWSSEQVEKMLTDSPWAKKVILVVGTLREEGLGGFQQSGGGFGGGGGATQRGDTDDAQFQRIRRVPVIVVWTSALPIRQALVRRQSGPDVRIAADQQPQLNQAETSYIVAVIGLPLRLVAKGAINDVKSNSALKPNKKDPIPVGDIRVFQDGDQTVRVEFLFAKSAAIAADDKEVAFTTKLGGLEITKKFRLADMMIGGKLVL
jgi:hypothetical protein